MASRRSIGVFLVLAGIPFIAYGIVTALRELAGLYGSVLEHPMDDPKDGGEQGASERMFRSAIIGGIGVLPFAVGVRLVLRRSRRQDPPLR